MTPSAPCRLCQGEVHLCIWALAHRETSWKEMPCVCDAQHVQIPGEEILQSALRRRPCKCYIHVLSSILPGKAREISLYIVQETCCQRITSSACTKIKVSMSRDRSGPCPVCSSFCSASLLLVDRMLSASSGWPAGAVWHNLVYYMKLKTSPGTSVIFYSSEEKYQISLFSL